MEMENIKEQYQTPEYVCKYMANLIPENDISILEPTPGKGNLVRAIKDKNTNYLISAPDNYFDLPKNKKFDCVVMNPPFSSKSAYGIPPEVAEKGMKLGYYFLWDCMERSDHIIALMPWFTISDSDVRLRKLLSFGLKSLTALPRKTFNYARIQTVIIELRKGYKGQTIFRFLENTEKENTLPPYEDNDEYDYGHNVPRYHIDGEGDLPEIEQNRTENGQNLTK